MQHHILSECMVTKAENSIQIICSYCFNLQGTASGWGLLQISHVSISVELSIIQKWITLTFKYFPVIDEMRFVALVLLSAPTVYSLKQTIMYCMCFANFFSCRLNHFHQVWGFQEQKLNEAHTFVLIMWAMSCIVEHATISYLVCLFWHPL